jgi:hypothetical protein
MDRRRFAKLIAAAVIGVRAADEVLPAGPTLFGEPVTVAAHPTAKDATGGYLVREDFAAELDADLLLYGNAYRRVGGARIAPGHLDVEKLVNGWRHVVVRHA